MVNSAPITSTTAPGKVFESRTELAEHYKSDWHKYNLKRKEAGLPLLEHVEFQARWDAALALRKEKQALEQKKGGSGNGTDHIKQPKQQQQQIKKNGTSKKKNNDDEEPQTASSSPDAEPTTKSGTNNGKAVTIIKVHPKETAESQENPEINPLQCLFDSYISQTVEDNVEYMRKNYDFFIPDQEHLTDVEGLLGYCQEKIKLGHLCLYCDKTSKTWQGCQKHMISKQHGKLRYEAGYWDDLDVFYDFGKEECEVIPAGKGRKKNAVTDAAMDTKEDSGDAMETSGAEDEEGGWEDMDEDVGEEGKVEDDDDEDDTLYGGYEKEIARFGLNVTALGELVFPDGRIVGHRALQRYYKQRPRPAPQGTALLAAQEAAGERLYDGRVVNINPQHYALPHGSAGGTTMKGAGKGILVSTDKSKDGRIMSFSAMSLYRYRAVIRKQRREDVQGKRIFFKQSMNMNKMGKKANNIMNGINMTHCLR